MTHLIWVRFIAITASQDDRDGRHDKGVGPTNDSRQTGPKEGLKKSVYAGNKE